MNTLVAVTLMCMALPARAEWRERMLGLEGGLLMSASSFDPRASWYAALSGEWGFSHAIDLGVRASLGHFRSLTDDEAHEVRRGQVEVTGRGRWLAGYLLSPQIEAAVALGYFDYAVVGPVSRLGVAVGGDADRFDGTALGLGTAVVLEYRAADRMTLLAALRVTRYLFGAEPWVVTLPIQVQYNWF
jgi:hypothetical protein